MDIIFSNAQTFDVGFETNQEEPVTITNSEDTNVEFSNPIQIEVDFEANTEMTCAFDDGDSFECDFGKPVEADEYQGIYEVTPTENTQTLSTANKVLKQNVVVKPIPSNYGRITWDGATITVS